MEKFFENILPVGGGSLGAIMAQISMAQVWETVILAAIGGLVGYLVKMCLDLIFKRDKSSG